ncbi:hypothetical protein AK812_SmicGene22763 [Symbiodinium microadriaticum]|uniref:Uncharacterized protein n=1 Tax=Symbiodinium microadriaticum TaxID=2951 RepID=A0A1Q9DJ07_SYMMI|nr:hypothetical protein AK812_SmicGene22763 [Symbiodinium microadriaticum]
MPGEKNAGADAGAPAKFRQIEGEKVIAGQRVHGVQVLRPVRFFVTESCPAAGCTVQDVALKVVDVIRPVVESRLAEIRADAVNLGEQDLVDPGNHSLMKRLVGYLCKVIHRTPFARTPEVTILKTIYFKAPSEAVSEDSIQDGDGEIDLCSASENGEGCTGDVDSDVVLEILSEMEEDALMSQPCKPHPVDVEAVLSDCGDGALAGFEEPHDAVEVHPDFVGEVLGQDVRGASKLCHSLSGGLAIMTEATRRKEAARGRLRDIMRRVWPKLRAVLAWNQRLAQRRRAEVNWDALRRLVATPKASDCASEVKAFDDEPCSPISASSADALTVVETMTLHDAWLALQVLIAGINMRPRQSELSRWP